MNFDRYPWLKDMNSPTAQKSIAEARQYGLRHWPDRHNFNGFLATPQHRCTTGTVIIFHGNAGAAQQRAFYRDALAPLGLRVILAEYPGYSGRSGRPVPVTPLMTHQPVTPTQLLGPGNAAPGSASNAAGSPVTHAPAPPSPTVPAPTSPVSAADDRR